MTHRPPPPLQALKFHARAEACPTCCALDLEVVAEERCERQAAMLYPANAVREGGGCRFSSVFLAWTLHSNRRASQRCLLPVASRPPPSPRCAGAQPRAAGRRDRRGAAAGRGLLPLQAGGGQGGAGRGGAAAS